MESLSAIVAFTRVAQLGSFAAAGRQLGLSASAVGKSIARLENRLGVRLFNRSTRRVKLTVEGELFYQRCVRILDELEEAEALASAGRATPRGRLRVEMPIGFGRLKFMPMLATFMSRYPELVLELSFTDSVVDPVEAGIDVAVRLTEVPDSRLACHPLGHQRLGVYAAPGYLERAGMPCRPNDLGGHECLGLHQLGRSAVLSRAWRFRNEGQDVEIEVSGRLRCSDSEMLVQAAAAGLGIIQVPDYVASNAVERGALLELLKAYRPIGSPITAVWPSNRHLLPRVRVVVDFLVELLTPSAPGESATAAPVASPPGRRD